MADKKHKADIAKMTFEQAIKELTGIVAQIEQGEISLEDSLTQYERGMALKDHCQKILREFETRIEKISREARSEGQGQESA